jgi:hypothetical protein
MDEVDLGETIEKYSMEYFGFFVQVLDGAIFQNAFHPIRPVIDDFNNGFALVFCEHYWKL